MASNRSLAPLVLCLCFSLCALSCSGDEGEPTPKPATQASPVEEALPEEPDPVMEPGHAQMLQWLEELRERTDEENPYLGGAELRAARAKLEALAEDAPVRQRLALLAQVGVAEMHLGHEDVAIEVLTEAHGLLPDSLAAGLDSESASNVAFFLGVAYMRFAESQNCCALNVPGSCILPFEGEARHTRPEGSQQAQKMMLEVLDRADPNSVRYMEALWILNVASMTLGEYPAKVPEEYRIPPASFEKVSGFPHFENVAAKAGVDTFSLSGGAVADDFDGDGLIDLMVSSWDTAGQLRYFRNSGDGTFEDWTERSGLLGIFGGLNLFQADYDNDGDMDVLLLRGAWLFEAGQHPNSLLRNDGKRFTDVTIASGMGEAHFPTQAASWADYDLDGDLDLYVGNESTDRLEAPGQLWRNEGNGKFTDVAVAAGVTNMAWAKAAIWGDYDNDRYPDLYISNLHGANRLYHNNGDGTFTDVAESCAVTEPLASFPTWFWDADNDGHLDLFVSAYAGSVGHLAASYMGKPSSSSSLSRLYHGDGKGGFRSVGKNAGFHRPALAMGANHGDLDGDGYLDLYLGTGDPDFKNLMPNAMLMNRQGRFFMDVSTTGGFSHLQKGHAILFADFDNDGDLDVFEEMGGAYLGDRFQDALYENPGFGNHWLGVELVGTDSNRFGVGARLHATIGKGPNTRSVFKHVNSGGTFGGSPMRQTLGLSVAERIGSLEIFWPVTGKTQVLKNLPMDKTIRIEEGQPGYKVLSLPRFSIGD